MSPIGVVTVDHDKLNAVFERKIEGIRGKTRIIQRVEAYLCVTVEIGGDHQHIGTYESKGVKCMIHSVHHKESTNQLVFSSIQKTE